MEPRFYEFDHYRLDARKRLLLRDDEPVPLRPKVFEILLALVRRPHATIDKDELMQAVWPDTAVEEGNLTQNVSVLRKALGGRTADDRFIVTVPGRGYCFTADVRVVDANAAWPTR